MLIQWCVVGLLLFSICLGSFMKYAARILYENMAHPSLSALATDQL